MHQNISLSNNYHIITNIFRTSEKLIIQVRARLPIQQSYEERMSMYELSQPFHPSPCSKKQRPDHITMFIDPHVIITYSSVIMASCGINILFSSRLNSSFKETSYVLILHSPSFLGKRSQIRDKIVSNYREIKYLY